MSDFNVIDIPSTLSRVVQTWDDNGAKIADGGVFQRSSALAEYVFAEALEKHGFLEREVSVSRIPSLTIKWSELNAKGQIFVRAEYEKWFRSIDDIQTSESAMTPKIGTTNQKNTNRRQFAQS